MQYAVYILTNKDNHVLYVGVTNNLQRRIFEHRTKSIQGFTQRYNLTKLVYYELTSDISAAIIREKQLKAGSRKRKLDLIATMNPKWEDLYERIL